MSKESSGFISSKKGLRLELKIFRYCKSSNWLCIFNDITNSLRHGDFTIPIHGIPNIVEVKSGRSSKNNLRAQRQKIRVQNLLNYLKDDQAKRVYPEQPDIIMHRCALLTKEKNHIKKLNRILVQTIQHKRNTLTRIENGLYYYICTNINTIDNDFNKLIKDGKWCTSVINEEKFITNGYIPFTLLINEPEILFKFYNDEYVIVVLIDLNIISQKFYQYGYMIEFLNDPIYFLQLKAINSDFSMKISRHFFGRITAEFLSLNWFIKELCTKPDSIKKLASR